MGPPTLSFLLTRKGPQPRLSRQAPRRSETAARSQPTLLRRSRCRSRRSAAVRQTHAPPAPSRLGRLCQASLRWSPAGVALSRPLHPSRGHLQSSLVGLRPVTFRWKDYAHAGEQGKMTLGTTEFLRRFFLHVLPRGFVRIRHFGFLANRW